LTKIKLRKIAHARSGDKGDTLCIALIPYNANDYDRLREKVTKERVQEHFKNIIKGEVIRYEADNLKALNFVFSEALDGGVTRSLRLDRHGKTLSSKLLDMKIDM
jgi:hypothetical protein